MWLTKEALSLRLHLAFFHFLVFQMAKQFVYPNAKTKPEGFEPPKPVTTECHMHNKALIVVTRTSRNVDISIMRLPELPFLSPISLDWVVDGDIQLDSDENVQS